MLLKSGLTIREILRVVCPNGVVFLGGIPELELKAKLTAAGIRKYKIIRQNGIWAKIVKARPKEMDEWTHWRHGADGNAVGRDHVEVPNAVRWRTGPKYFSDSRNK